MPDSIHIWSPEASGPPRESIFAETNGSALVSMPVALAILTRVCPNYVSRCCS